MKKLPKGETPEGLESRHMLWCGEGFSSLRQLIQTVLGARLRLCGTLEEEPRSKHSLVQMVFYSNREKSSVVLELQCAEHQ